MNSVCNCGEPSRYSHFVNGKEVGSCNKYMVCPTYSELLSRVVELQKALLITVGSASHESSAIDIRKVAFKALCGEI